MARVIDDSLGGQERVHFRLEVLSANKMANLKIQPGQKKDLHDGSLENIGCVKILKSPDLSRQYDKCDERSLW